MPVELVDENGQEIDLETAAGSTLRTKLEEALAENKELNEFKTSAEAQRVIGDKGLKLVKTEDLNGVSPDEVEAKALALEKERQEARTESVRSVFEERGLEGDKLDEAVEEFLEGNEVSGSTDTDDEPDFADMVAIGGDRPNVTEDAPGMDDPMGNLVAGVQESDSNKK